MAASWTDFLMFSRQDRLRSHADGDDGDLQTGVVLPEPRFTDNGNGTITDNLTGFLWTKDAGCLEVRHGKKHLKRLVLSATVTAGL